MRATRYSVIEGPSKTPEKRKATTTTKPEPPASKKARVQKASARAAADWAIPLATGPPLVLVPAVLSFSFDDAKKHLVKADPRFKDLFALLTCKPFEQLETVHPFRALVTSILGQQISCKAARSISLKFVRMYEPTIAEDDWEHEKSPTSFFPSPDQVVQTDLARLKTAGLSARKAEYIRDVAVRFADGRLSTEKLLESTDEELAEMLIAVRGIGRWTVDMFAIFSLRRPDILPVGDLGIQRGILRWFLAQHSPMDAFTISPDKTSTTTGTLPNKAGEHEDDEALPVFGAAAETAVEGAVGEGSSFSIPGHQQSPSKTADVGGGAMADMPTPFTPSIKALLRSAPAVTPLPEGLTAAILKTRLSSKKKIKGAFLSPKEMEELTAPWKPYRSLAVYYMWALADPKDV